MMKVILNADDFGSTHEMNMAIDHAMKNGMAYSASLIMGSEYTEEAIKMAFDGDYIGNIHCHLNLASCVRTGHHFVPLNDEYKASRFCKDGEFSSALYYKPDYRKYVDIIYKELETQYLMFKKMTDGRADYDHLDFHLYRNLSRPVAAAYDRLIKNYNIGSARFFGEHQGEVKERFWLRMIHSSLMRHWRKSKAYVVRSSRIEYYLARKEQFANESVIELFVHPDYRNGVLIDKTQVLYEGDMKPLDEQIRAVEQSGNIEFISWPSLKK